MSYCFVKGVKEVTFLKLFNILITFFSFTDVLRITVQGQPINGGGDAVVRNTKEEYGKLCIPVPGDDAQVQRHNTLGMQYTLCTVLPEKICIRELFRYSSM